MARILLIFAATCVALAFADHPPWMENLHNKDNEYRGKHGVKPLTMNEDLNKVAQEWATKLANKCEKLVITDHASKEIRKFEGKTAGENIHSLQIENHPEMVKAYADEHASEAADDWYSEIEFYPWPEYKGQKLASAVGHFTQQVWKGSEQVGYGLGMKEGCDRYYVVGRYWPGGNMKGSYGVNVLPKKE